MTLPSGRWRILDEVDSTQTVAKAALDAGSGEDYILARHQVRGKGRFDRVWHSERDQSLTLSIVFRDFSGHPMPHLIGMSLAVAAATALGARVRWPNDIVMDDRKLGGILTELHRGVPVVGIGLNLLQTSFPPEISATATSVSIGTGEQLQPREAADRILARVAQLPEPTDWSILEPEWMSVDSTPGKRYRLPDGRVVGARGIGNGGQLLCSIDGEDLEVLAADAHFGHG